MRLREVASKSRALKTDRPETVQSKQRLRYLDAMGIQSWRLRGTGPEAAGQPEASVVADGLGWVDLQRCVASCTACELHEQRTQTVFGTGDHAARWLVIGEAPGAEEDLAGEPFVGRAGGLLDAMIKAVGARREQVYIANIVKCRPPGNRNPSAGEAGRCAHFLRRQIELVEPRLILAMGRVAANNLLGNQQTVGALRDGVHEFGTGRIPVVVTYHPAYLLRKPSEKAKAWADLRKAMAISPAVAA